MLGTMFDTNPADDHDSEIDPLFIRRQGSHRFGPLSKSKRRRSSTHLQRMRVYPPAFGMSWNAMSRAVLPLNLGSELCCVLGPCEYQFPRHEVH